MTVARRRSSSDALDRAGMTWRAKPPTAMDAAIKPAAVVAVPMIDAQTMAQTLGAADAHMTRTRC